MAKVTYAEMLATILDQMGVELPEGKINAVNLSGEMFYDFAQGGGGGGGVEPLTLTMIAEYDEDTQQNIYTITDVTPEQIKSAITNGTPIIVSYHEHEEWVDDDDPSITHTIDNYYQFSVDRYAVADDEKSIGVPNVPDYTILLLYWDSENNYWQSPIYA